MADVKTTAKTAETKKAEVKTAEVKTEEKATVKKIDAKVPVQVKKAEEKAPAKKAPAKKVAAKPAAKTTVKKETVKKETTKKAAEVKATVNFQFAGKSYTTEDLVKIAKDVWVYDLNKDLKDFKTLELYVKPEESTAYYVVNEEITGSFMI